MWNPIFHTYIPYITFHTYSIFIFLYIYTHILYMFHVYWSISSALRSSVASLSVHTSRSAASWASTARLWGPASWARAVARKAFQGAPRGPKLRAGEDVGEDVGGTKNEGIQPQKSWDYDVLAGLNRKNQGIMMFLMVLNVYKPSKCWGIRIVWIWHLFGI